MESATYSSSPKHLAGTHERHCLPGQRFIYKVNVRKTIHQWNSQIASLFTIVRIASPQSSQSQQPSRDTPGPQHDTAALKMDEQNPDSDTTAPPPGSATLSIEARLYYSTIEKARQAYREGDFETCPEDCLEILEKRTSPNTLALSRPASSQPVFRSGIVSNISKKQMQLLSLAIHAELRITIRRRPRSCGLITRLSGGRKKKTETRRWQLRSG
jgi:hypothetical protein